jgi:Prenyltransferase and squalene oxidase repeat
MSEQMGARSASKGCNRRRFLSRSTATLLGLTGLGGAAGLAFDVREQLPDGTASKDMINSAAQRAIDRGLEFLARNQHDDGSLGERQYRGNVAVTSLGGLAFLAAGHQPGRGPRGKVVLDAVQFVLGQEDARRPGFLHNPLASPHGPMYGHGFGTLFLAEVHGMIHGKKLRDDLHDKLKRAVDIIISSQNGEGGWRYQPERRDADISVTICQIMALRAARNAGFHVPKSTVDKCIEYVKGCQSHDGGFRYMKQGGPPAFARTAAGVVALHSAGVYKSPEVESGLRYLMQYKPNQAFPRRDLPDLHYFYGHYYAAQAMWTAGEPRWSEWFPAIREELVSRSRMREDGSWSDSICSHYATAMACIILQIPNNYLSILQK